MPGIVKSFQFLLVRLKVQMPGVVTLYKPISIPFGAIKSTLTGQNGIVLQNFNSFWCD